MADSLDDLVQVEISQLIAVANLTNTIVGNATGLRDGAKKACELLARAKHDDPDADKVADKDLAKIVRLHKIIQESVGQLDDDVEALRKTQSAMEKAAKAKKQ